MAVTVQQIEERLKNKITTAIEKTQEVIIRDFHEQQNLTAKNIVKIFNILKYELNKV